MGKKVGQGRTSFEGKFAKLLMQHNRKWYALRSGNNQGWDVHLYLPTDEEWQGVVLFEVKTSVKKSITFSGRIYDQLKRYRGIWQREHIPTYYAYRWVTQNKKYQGKPLTEHDKWRFFHIDDMRKTTKWRNGMTWKQFMRRLR